MLAAPLPEMVQPSSGSTVAFVLVVTFVVVTFLAGTRRADEADGGQWFARVALGTFAWLGITAAASASGMLGRQTLPPPLMIFFVASMAVALWVGLSRLGSRLASAVPLAALVAFHGFRLPLELVLHAWYEQGVLPVQMTYEGHNFDIVTGIVAVLVGLWLWRAKPPAALARKVVLGFNVIGLGLLITVASIAVMSSPIPLRQYMDDPPVLLALHVPYGWIVPFCVGAALAGHVIIFRRLRQSS